MLSQILVKKGYLFISLKPLLMPLKMDSVHWEVLEDLKQSLLDLRFIDKKCETIAEVRVSYMLKIALKRNDCNV